MSSRLFVPLLFLGFGFIFHRQLSSKNLLKIFILTSLLYFVFPCSLFIFRSESLSRFRQIGLFTNPGVQLEIDEQIREDNHLFPLITRMFHNKVLDYSLKFLENYQTYFTGKFLFTSGGFPMRFRLPQMGVLYFFEFIPLLLGLISLLKKKKREYLFVLCWLVIGPVAAAVTIEDIPNFQRALLTLPPLLITISLGIREIYLFFQKRRVYFLGIVLIVSFYLYGLSFFLHQYFVHQKVHQPWYRMAEMKELVLEVTKREEKYEKIIMSKNSTEPYIYFLFYQKIEPKEWHKMANKLDWKGDWHWKNYYFLKEDCPLAVEEVEKKEENLYIEKGECLEYEWKETIKEIRRPDDSLALRLVEINLPEYRRWKEN